MSHLVRPRSLALASLLSFGAPATAAAMTDDTMDIVDPEAADEGLSWGPIIGACLGVMFGGALALWQIRGMKNRD